MPTKWENYFMPPLKLKSGEELTLTGTIEFTNAIFDKQRYKYPEVEKIIYNLKGKVTIVYFTDGDKVIVRCAEGEEFDKESGLAMAIIRKQFKSRKEFLRLVESGFVQE